MILFLCEKPSQAKDIGRVLGATSRRDGYLEGQGKQVTWCIGHLLEMTAPDGYKPEWKSWRLDTLPIIPEQWKLEVTKRGGKQFKIVKGLLKGVDEVVLATDADRRAKPLDGRCWIAAAIEAKFPGFGCQPWMTPAFAKPCTRFYRAKRRKPFIKLVWAGLGPTGWWG